MAIFKKEKYTYYNYKQQGIISNRFCYVFVNIKHKKSTKT